LKGAIGTVSEFDTPPEFAHVHAAALRLAGEAVRTPLLESDLLSRRLGVRLLLKAECLQRTGSFKFRGAYNRLSQLTYEERQSGVVAFSSGNHAQGVALAAKLLGIRATIVMPSDAPAIKRAKTREYGAEVIEYDRWTEDREAVADRVVAERGGVIVKPFDDREIIAGQGTVALEVIEQAEAMDVALDGFAACASGGGLAAGCALVIKALSPSTRIYCAEPAALDDHARSLAAGTQLSNSPEARSICDALMAPKPGNVTFQINRTHLSGGLVATDEEVRRAMAVAFEEFKLVIEPGGAVALAAALAGRMPHDGGALVVVASGGNVNPAQFIEALSA